jgi:two-component system alkaline phosphatase synthesis response regulator PhoP
MLPKKSKFEVGRDLHGAGINIPTLMLTARSQVVDKVVGLRMGGMTI